MDDIDKAVNRLKEITDDIGVIEHSTGSQPNLDEGYSIDDQARAFLVALKVKDKLIKERKVYLDFIRKAAHKTGFHNDMDKNGRWADQPGTGEWFGRAVLALEEGKKWGSKEEQDNCRKIMEIVQPAELKTQDLRTMANLILAGYDKYAEKLLYALGTNRQEDWIWFEPGLYYDNGRLPMALLAAGKIKEGTETLNWLIEKIWDKEKDCFNFVGNKGWWVKGKDRAIVDQQPMEAGSMVETCVAAFKITGKKKYLNWAKKAWEWYFGINVVGGMMLDVNSGGVKDGLSYEEVSKNEGAEALLSFLVATIALEEING